MTAEVEDWIAHLYCLSAGKPFTRGFVDRLIESKKLANVGVAGRLHRMTKKGVLDYKNDPWHYQYSWLELPSKISRRVEEMKTRADYTRFGMFDPYVSVEELVRAAERAMRHLTHKQRVALAQQLATKYK